MMDNKSFVFRFADIEVHEREFRLIKAGEALAVEPKAFRVLLFLLRNPQKVVRKEELLDAVWGDTAVSENSLARSVGLLRRLLGDDVHEQRFIATVATVGYRFIAPVEALEDGKTALESPEKPRSLSEQAATDSHSESASVPLAVQPAASITSEVRNNGQIKEGNKSRRWLVASVTVLIVGLVAAGWYLRRPLPPPRITEYNQITHDGRIKDVIGTDGSRLYFALHPADAISQVSVSGGDTTQVPIELPDFGVLAISPDGATFLIQSGPEASLWNQGILGGSLRHMNGIFAQSAAYSADGRYVAYATQHGDLIRMLSDGTKPQMLVSQKTGVSSLAWSPDGSTIRFSELNKIWEVSSTGSNLHRLLSGQAGSDAHCCGHWTPDGKFFIFLSGTQPGGSGLFSQIWALDERRGPFRQPSSDPIQLTSGPLRWGGAIPSKDGTKIFARGVTQRGELVRFDSRTRQLQPFLNGISAEFVNFSPDGKSVAYVTFPEEILWRANADGSGRVQLTDPPLNPKSPRWSPDGSQILFTDGPNAQNSALLYEVSSQGGGKPHRLIPDDNEDQWDGNWSPDGRRIVFHTWSNGDASLRIFDGDSHRVTNLPGSVGIFSPRWSPDGRFIVAMPGNSESLKVFNLETHQWSTVLMHEGLGFPSWSRDSRYLYILYADQQPGVYRVSVKGGVPERVVDLKEFHHAGSVGLWMGLDPNDAPLLLRDVGTDDLYALTLEVK
jgi:DNA-binding winged helix-turn-helix (wHTH) protein/Tol biopolymer transport system component